MKNNPILFVGNHFSNQTGARYVYDELIIRLGQNGWKTYTTSRYQAKILRIIDMLWTVISKFNLYQVAVVDVFSGPAFLWAEMATYLLHIIRRPVILTLRGGNLPIFAQKHPDRVRKVLKLAKKVVTPSAYLYENLKTVRADICIIPNPIELEHYVFHQRVSPLPRLIWLRAFHEIYNPSLAPRVLHELKEIWPDIQLAMVGPDKGDGSLIHMLEVTDQFQVQDRILVPGAVPRDEVPDWLNKNDIFINTTNVDNTPVSVIEAMACGLCIVSTNVGGIPYLLEDGLDALLVPPEDAGAMAEAVNRILSNPRLAEQLSINARKKAENFSWDVVYPAWESLFNEVIETSLAQNHSDKK